MGVTINPIFLLLATISNSDQNALKRRRDSLALEVTIREPIYESRDGRPERTAISGVKSRHRNYSEQEGEKGVTKRQKQKGRQGEGKPEERGMRKNDRGEERRERKRARSNWVFALFPRPRKGVSRSLARFKKNVRRLKKGIINTQNPTEIRICYETREL